MSSENMTNEAAERLRTATEFVADRLEHHYGESPNTDYIRALRFLPSMALAAERRAGADEERERIREAVDRLHMTAKTLAPPDGEIFLNRVIAILDAEADR